MKITYKQHSTCLFFESYTLFLTYEDKYNTIRDDKYNTISTITSLHTPPSHKVGWQSTRKGGCKVNATPLLGELGDMMTERKARAIGRKVNQRERRLKGFQREIHS